MWFSVLLRTAPIQAPIQTAWRHEGMKAAVLSQRTDLDGTGIGCLEYGWLHLGQHRVKSVEYRLSSFEQGRPMRMRAPTCCLHDMAFPRQLVVPPHVYVYTCLRFFLFAIVAEMDEKESWFHCATLCTYLDDHVYSPLIGSITFSILSNGAGCGFTLHSITEGRALSRMSIVISTAIVAPRVQVGLVQKSVV